MGEQPREQTANVEPHVLHVLPECAVVHAEYAIRLSTMASQVAELKEVVSKLIWWIVALLVGITTGSVGIVVAILLESRRLADGGGVSGPLGDTLSNAIALLQRVVN